MKTKAIVFVAPGKAELLERELDEKLAPERVLLKTEVTLISPGTEFANLSGVTNRKEGYKLYLTADNGKQEIREIYLEVDKQYNPVRISMRQGKNQWVRIVVTHFKAGQKFPDSHFIFPKDQYPNAEIIDLR